MKRAHLLFSAVLVIAFGIPAAIALAQTFAGPPNCSQPPCSNVAGVIWNAAGTSVQQPNAQVDFTGTNWSSNPTVKSDFGLANGKAFRVDNNGLSTFNYGNWGGAGGAAKPLQITENGDFYAPGVSPYIGTGAEGRIQARKFCFYPGTNPSDCVTSWNSGSLTGVTAGTGITVTGSAPSPTVAVDPNWSGSTQYVKKAGDTMSGNLYISNISGANSYGLQSWGGGYGIMGYGFGAGSYGGYFNGDEAIYGTANGPYGIYVTNSSSSAVGGEFISSPSTGNGIGVIGQGAAIGIEGIPWATTGTGGNFQTQSGVAVSAHANAAGTAVSSTSLSGSGVAGFFQGALYGIDATAKNSTGAAVRGTASGSAAAGVDGENSVTNGYGVYGHESAATGYGVYGSGHVGVYADGNSYGLDAYANSASGIGVHGIANGGTGGRFAASSVASPTIYADIGTATNAVDAHGDVNISDTGGANLGLTVAGRIQTGDANRYGGIWVNKNTDAGLFVGESTNGTVTTDRQIGFYTNATGWGLTLHNNGRVGIGIGQTNPTDELQVNGDIRVGTSGTNGCLKGFGGTSIAGTCSSDERLKTNIEPLKSELSTVMALQPVTYNWRAEEYPDYHFDGKMTNVGLIAQQVEQVDPTLVGQDDKGMMTIHFEKLPFLTLKAVQEEQTEIDALKQENQDLKARLDALEAKLK